MKPPPFLLGAALLFWGWQAGFLLVGAALAIVLEGPHWLKMRWEFSDQDFRRIWTFCELVLLTAAVYAFNANNGLAEFRGFLQHPSLFSSRNPGLAGARAVIALIGWLPMIYFLFVGAAAYSARVGIPLEAISQIARHRRKKALKLGRPPPPSRLIHVSYPFFALCLFSASYHASENTTFFWGLAALLAWALWPKRSPKFGWPLWAGALATALALGYFGQRGLRSLQRYISNVNPTWFLNLSRRGFDPARTSTMLGQVGRAKVSGQIVIRLEPKGARTPPWLLRQAAYRTYRTQVWYSGIPEKDFDTIYFEKNGTNDTTWVLLPDQTNTAAVNIACYLPGGRGLLPLPAGAARLEHLVAFDLRTNSLGTVLEKAGPGLVLFDAFYGPGQTLGSPPLTNDIHEVPPRESRESPALDQVIAELNLRGNQSLEDAMRTVRQFFQSKFAYGFWDERDALTSTNETPLSRFLLHTRRGHCEYFATATVLLLRQLGFPARYAVGYAVHEAAGRGYVVRQRDAHAWCLVWRDGAWQDFDTTPASWMQVEAKRASPLQFLSDLWSRLRFEVLKFFWGQSNLRRYVLWSLVVILGLLLYQIIFRAHRRRQPRNQSEAATLIWPGLDSEFYQLERLLAQRGLLRQPSEPLSHWLARATADPALLELRAALQVLLGLHYRYRFDPLGLSPAERDALRRQARACLGKIV